MPEQYTPADNLPQPPRVGVTHPRNDFGTHEVLAIANALQARQRDRLTRLSAAGRFRKWGRL